MIKLDYAVSVSLFWLISKNDICNYVKQRNGCLSHWYPLINCL